MSPPPRPSSPRPISANARARSWASTTSWSATEADAALQEALTVDPEIRAFLTEWLSQDYGVRF